MCSNSYHFNCARSLDWDFEESPHFYCLSHRSSGSSACPDKAAHGKMLQHTLFTFMEAAPLKNDQPANFYTPSGGDHSIIGETSALDNVPSSTIHIDHFRTEKLSVYEGYSSETRLVNAVRNSLQHQWNIALEASVDPLSQTRILSVARQEAGLVDGLCPGDIICTINGIRVGTSALDTVERVLKILSQEVEVVMEVCDGPSDDDAWLP